MYVKWLSLAGYRSIRDLNLELAPINLITGPNGCGKSNLYRGLLLIAAAAEGRFAQSIAEEGGMSSVLWAGARRKGPVQMSLGVVLDDFEYQLVCGLPTQSCLTKFNLEAEIKKEEVHYRHDGKRTRLMDRKNALVSVRDENGRALEYPMELLASETALAELREPQRFPVLSMIRSEILSWRFYHEFRSDSASPLRELQVGFRSPILHHDGSNLAAALQTIYEIGNGDRLADAINRAFPGGVLEIAVERQRFQVTLRMPGFQRPFEARELSDGTLQYLCILAALLSPRPPTLLAINEPETSIHPDLFEPLAELIVDASNRSQLWITTHSDRLAQLIEKQSGVTSIRLDKRDGETRIVEQK